MAQQIQHPPIASASLDSRGIPQFLRGPLSDTATKQFIPAASSSSTSTSMMPNKRHSGHGGGKSPHRNSPLRGPPVPQGRSPHSETHKPKPPYSLTLDSLKPETPNSVVGIMVILLAAGYVSYSIYKNVLSGKRKEQAERSARELIEAEADARERDGKKEKGRERKSSNARRLSNAEKEGDWNGVGVAIASGGSGMSSDGSRDRLMERDRGAMLHPDMASQGQRHEDEQNSRVIPNRNGYSSSSSADGQSGNDQSQTRRRTSSSSSIDRKAELHVDTSSGGPASHSLPTLSSSMSNLEPIVETPTPTSGIANIGSGPGPDSALSPADGPNSAPAQTKKVRAHKERRKLERIASAQARREAVLDEVQKNEMVSPATTPRMQQDVSAGGDKLEDLASEMAEESDSADPGPIEVGEEIGVQMAEAVLPADPLEVLSATSSNVSWSRVNGKAKSKSKAGGGVPSRGPPIVTDVRRNGLMNGLSPGTGPISEDRLSSAASVTTQSEREESMSVSSEMSKCSSFSLVDSSAMKCRSGARQPRSSSATKRNVPGSAGWTRPSEPENLDSAGVSNGQRVPEVSVTSPIEDKEVGTSTLRSRQRIGGKDTSEYRALAAERDRLVEDNTRLSSLLALSSNKESLVRADLEKAESRARLAESEANKWRSENEASKKESLAVGSQRQRQDDGRNRDDQYKRFNGLGSPGRGGREGATRGRGALRGRMPSGSGHDGNPWEHEVEILRREVDRRALDQRRREAEFQALMQQQAAQLVQAMHQTAFLDQALRNERAMHSAQAQAEGSPAYAVNGHTNGASPWLGAFPGQATQFGNGSGYLQPLRTSQPPSPQPMSAAQLGSPWVALNMPTSPTPNRHLTSGPMGRSSQEDLSKHLAMTVLKKREGSPTAIEHAADGIVAGAGAGGQGGHSRSQTVNFAINDDPEVGTQPVLNGLSASASLPAGLAKSARSTALPESQTSPRSVSDLASHDDDEEDDTSIPLFASVHHDPAHIQALMIQAELERQERGRRASLRRNSGTSSGTSNGQLSPAAQTARKLFGNGISRFEAAGLTGDLSPFQSRSASTATTAMSSLDGADMGVDYRRDILAKQPEEEVLAERSLASSREGTETG